MKDLMSQMREQVDAMPLESFLGATFKSIQVSRSSPTIMKCIMEEFVTQMHKRGKDYHWDDCATDIIGLPHGEPIFTHEEALLCNEIVALLNCEEMFQLSLKLHGIDNNDEEA